MSTNILLLSWVLHVLMGAAVFYSIESKPLSLSGFGSYVFMYPPCPLTAPRQRMSNACIACWLDWSPMTLTLAKRCLGMSVSA